MGRKHSEDFKRAAVGLALSCADILATVNWSGYSTSICTGLRQMRLNVGLD